MRVFLKRYPKNAVNLSNGKTVRFEDVGNDVGFLHTEDPVTIAELEQVMSEHRGGVNNSTEEEYQTAIKKKLRSPVLGKSLYGTQTSGLVTAQLPPLPASEEVAPVTAEANPTPAVIVEPTPTVAPKTGKRK